jgi:hypothetical protein
MRPRGDISIMLLVTCYWLLVAGFTPEKPRE